MIGRHVMRALAVCVALSAAQTLTVRTPSTVMIMGPVRRDAGMIQAVLLPAANVSTMSAWIHLAAQMRTVQMECVSMESVCLV